MEIAGFIATIIMGITLGLMGGGGSILTVPIMVYLFGIDPMVAVAYSLFVVGLTSVIGSSSHFMKGNVDLKAGFIFAIPSILTVYAMRKFIVPLIPDPVFEWGTYHLSKSLSVLILFAMLMVIVSFTMIRKPAVRTTTAPHSLRYPFIFLLGLLVGLITGTVGAGGGFLIIPALVLMANLPMKKAVGTSLMIIAVNSLVGFVGDFGTGLAIDYQFLLIFSGFAIAGVLAGSFLSKYFTDAKLRPVFGWFVLVMGTSILIKELLF